VSDEISANVTAVDRLAGDLNAIRSAMQGLGGVFDGYDGTIGSGKVEGALDHFHSDSSDARGNLDGLLQRAAGLLTELSQGLHDADASLVDALSGDGS
jgi:hypothetical protein